MSHNTATYPAASIGHAAVLTALLILVMVCPTRSIADESDLHQKDREALQQCHRLDDVGDPSATGCYRELLNVAAQYAVRAEAHWRLGRFEEANRAFREAIRQDPGNPDLMARWGTLFLAVHQAADAGALFEEALQLDEQHSGALLGMAELLANRFEGKADGLIDQVLDNEPDNPRARLLRARLQLEVGNVDGARSTLLALIEDNQDPRTRLDSFALLSAADHVTGEAAPDAPSPWTSRALATNPRFGDIYAVPAYFYVITRRYREAVALLEQAAKVDSGHWDAHKDLGMNLLRLNRVDEARTVLEHAYSGDPFNAETVNTLRLLDSLDEFATVESGNLILRAHPQESPVLGPYVQELVNRTELEMAARYGYELERPVVLELYQHHDDFAVRTAGLPGIGILGATFGDVVVMDGPSAKSPADFDWYSAVWHELAHVVTLNATDNLVSRWFSEGVSVYEEQRFGPSPNASVPLDFLDALKEQRLLPVVQLDEGFMQPKYPNQIGISYVQAGLLCTFIADTYPGGLTRILEAYAAGADTPAAIEQGLDVSPDALDNAFFAHLETHFGPALNDYDSFKQNSTEALTALKEERFSDAETAARAVMALFPGYVGPANAYLILARASERQKQMDGSRTALRGYYERGGRDPDALAHLAEQLLENGQLDLAIDVGQTLVRLSPLTASYHAQLGDWLSMRNKHANALTEYRSVLALDPHDKATAHFQVASSLQALDRTEEARLELLKSLEIAPRYRPALALLIEINQ